MYQPKKKNAYEFTKSENNVLPFDEEDTPYEE